MSLALTTLSGPLAASQLQFGVVSTVGFPAVGVIGSRQLVKIDGEFMMVDVVPVANTVKVLQRGYNGTTASFHDVGAQVATSSVTNDFLDVPVGFIDTDPPDTDDVLTIGADTTFAPAGSVSTSGSIPMPIKNTTYLISKGSAAAIALITASAQSVGVQLTFMATTAFGHVITYAPGFNGDGATSNTATMAAKVGSTMTVRIGAGGLLAIIAQNGVTLT